MIRDRQGLASKLGYEFRDTGLLRAALTHRSASGANNERLEFLGDAILDAVLSARLYAGAPWASEGELSRLRAALVNKRALARIAASLGLGDFLLMGGGELKSGGYRRASVLADALEALIGAVYLDGGQGATEGLIDRLFDARVAEAIAGGANKDAKTRLQESLQKKGLGLPDYTVADVRGPAHERVFTVDCTVAAHDASARGEGSSRRRAEQRAAQAMLDAMSDG